VRDVYSFNTVAATEQNYCMMCLGVRLPLLKILIMQLFQNDQ